MSALLMLSRGIDAFNRLIGVLIMWLVLIMVLISAFNATTRYLFSMTSNAYLEIQWYIYAYIFMLGGGYTLLKNEHVRIDVIHNRLSERTRAWIDIFGVLFFLFPAAAMIGWMGWPFVVESYAVGEVSNNAGGLLRWPVKLAIPVGFAVLILAGVSHIIKCVGYLRGLCPTPVAKDEDRNADAAQAAHTTAQP